MHSWQTGQRTGHWKSVATMCGIALAVAGCSSTDNSLFGSSTNPASASAAGTGGFAQSFSQTTGQTSTPSPDDIDCPRVTIREGASTYMIGSGADTSALALRYQGTFARAARECALVGSTMTIKVGVQGRIILGPAGGPGQVEVPLRYAVVQEGLESKTVWTKFYKVPVIIPEGSSNVAFTHVEQDVAFPYPKNAADLENYIIYIGFDPLGKTDTPKKPAKKPANPPRRS
ncbi:MAG: hypothetical protein HY659_05110 [Rhizobiales bacterium]|nr:hypothetical protein [Hyphomicrobiales bacterium]